MRIITFPDVKMYEMFHEGLLATNSKGIELRVIGKVLTKLEAIGTLKTGSSLLYTMAENRPVELEDAEYETAKKFLYEVGWNGTAAKNAVRLLDLVDAAPTQEQFNERKNGILSLEKHGAEEGKG